jgi:hypothetical protein
MRLLAGLEMNSLQLPAQDIQGRLRDDQSGGDTGDHPLCGRISRRPFSFSQYEKFSGLGHASHLNMRYSLSY